MSEASDQPDEVEHGGKTLEERVEFLEKTFLDLTRTTAGIFEELNGERGDIKKAFDALADGTTRVIDLVTKRLVAIEQRLGIRRPS